MTNQRVANDEFTSEKQNFSCYSQPELNLYNEAESTSDYSSSYEAPIWGSVQERHHRSGKNKPAGDRNETITEKDATEICKYIGSDWKHLGRELGFTPYDLQDIDEDKNNRSLQDKAHVLLIKFKQQNGSDATKGRLAYALHETKRRDLAEKLLGSEPIGKTADSQTFLLKEEGRFQVPTDEHSQETFYVCRDIQGQLFLVRSLEGTEYEASCKVLQRQDNIADSLLKALDSGGVVKAEKARREREEFNKAQGKVVELTEKLRQIVNSLENQERQEESIDVSQQLAEDDKLIKAMQYLTTDMLQLTGTMGRLKDPFILQAQMYSFSIGLTATRKDLEERIKMLKDMASRNKEDAKETEKIDQLLQWCRNLEKTMKMRDKNFIKCFEDLTLEGQQRPRNDCSPSDPNPKPSRYEVDVPTVRRSSTQPVTQGELKTLAEQVCPPPDPMENEAEEHGIWSPDS